MKEFKDLEFKSRTGQRKLQSLCVRYRNYQSEKRLKKSKNNTQR